jgi:hypothetical protein
MARQGVPPSNTLPRLEGNFGVCRLRTRHTQAPDGGLTSPVATLPRTQRLKNPTATAKDDS